MNEMVKEKLPYTRGKAIALNTLCVILTFLFAAVLLVCVTAHRFVHEEPVAEAFSKVEVENMVLSDGTPLLTKINRDYIGEGVISEDKLTKVLRDGTFNLWVGEKAQAYTDYLVNHGQPGVTFPQILTPEIGELLDENEGTVRLYTGMHDFGTENPQILTNMKPDLENWNRTMLARYSTSFSAKLIFAAVSAWIWYVCGAILLALFVWMIVIAVRSRGSIGSAFQRYAVTCFVPGTLMLLWGLLGSLIVRLAGLGFWAATVKGLHNAPILTGGLTCLGCVALFIFGMLWKTIANAWHSRTRREKKPAPARVPAFAGAPATVPSPAPIPAAKVELAKAVTEPAPAKTKPAGSERFFCRFCGGELVNSDAKFCYKCGKAQE